MLLRGFQYLSYRGDRGSATVVAVAMVGVLLGVTGAGAYLGSVVVARHRAQAAADLAALAGAARLPAGAAAACSRAAAVARQMRADDTQCAVQGLDVVVTVEVAVAFAGAARAAARAGPESQRRGHGHRPVSPASALSRCRTATDRRAPAWRATVGYPGDEASAEEVRS
ncbi:Rv3654c family TadE-like protein [Mycobacterium sp.]|uniref:Rv3654c family TadE-like protein n=1 Tax=Mycobacterium sp. TaxID=1785 RepID=UPI00344E6E63